MDGLILLVKDVFGTHEKWERPDVTAQELHTLAVRICEFLTPGLETVQRLPEITQAHVKFLESRGYEVKNVEGAEKFIEVLNPMEMARFFADFALWQSKPPAPVKADPNLGGKN